MKKTGEGTGGEGPLVVVPDPKGPSRKPGSTVSPEMWAKYREAGMQVRKLRAAGKMALTDRQARFVEEYLVDLDANRAARESGAVTGKLSARVCAYRMLRNPWVKKEIARRKKERSKRVEAKADDVVRELMRLASSDVRKVLSARGEVLAPSELPTDIARAVSGIEVKEEKNRDGDVIGRVVKLKFWDKPKALELLSRHLGLLEEPPVQSVPLFSLPPGTVVEVGAPKMMRQIPASTPGKET